MTKLIDEQQLSKILPQKFPFRMIDKIVDFKEGKNLTAVKNITGGEWCFEGVSISSGVFPETLIIEAAAQAAFLFHKMDSQNSSSEVKVLLGKTKAEFLNSVHIGDTLALTTGHFKLFGQTGVTDVAVSVDDKRIADVTVFFSWQNN